MLIISAQRVSTQALEPENLPGNPNFASYELCDLRYLLNFSHLKFFLLKIVVMIISVLSLLHRGPSG